MKQHLGVSVLSGAVLLSSLLTSGPALSRPYDPQRQWFVEGSIGGVQPGPDGTDFGAGQDYGFALGIQRHPNADIAVVLNWVNARESSTAVETDITSGGVRGRAWLGANQWSAYGELGLRLYHVAVTAQPIEDSELNFGGELGAGVLYSRSTWWVGAGASLHSLIDSSSVEGGNLFTYTSYHVSIGAPIGR